MFKRSDEVKQKQVIIDPNGLIVNNIWNKTDSKTIITSNKETESDPVSVVTKMEVIDEAPPLVKKTRGRPKKIVANLETTKLQVIVSAPKNDVVEPSTVEVVEPTVEAPVVDHLTDTDESVREQADIIWEDIQNLETGIFGAANQPLKKFLTPLPLPANRDKLVVKYTISALLPIVCELLSSKYEVIELNKGAATLMLAIGPKENKHV